jgi:predicted nucleotidyltransferase
LWRFEVSVGIGSSWLASRYHRARRSCNRARQPFPDTSHMARVTLHVVYDGQSMTPLHEVLAPRVASWAKEGYPSDSYPAIAEIFDWIRDPDTGSPRFLRTPQIHALETYWYLRLIEGTPTVFDLYERFYPGRVDRLDALGMGSPEITRWLVDHSLEELWDRVRDDEEFVRLHRLEAVRETLALSYPSYILALAMGAGKTILIGAVIATEFALSLEYPDGPFVQNALVFAPGKTIIESLRELASVPYDRILPPRLYKPFAASTKLIFTRDGEKDIPVVRGSHFNVVVTNTEKIRIQKETIRRADLGQLLVRGRDDEARAEVANLRLRAIASLPHLAVFSDEAHHTFGRSLDNELKKVRKTVDYLAATTNVVAVVNTTGTPYLDRQVLRDVVIWYGLSEGIRDGILKDVSDNIQEFDFEGDVAAYVAHVVDDFFREYGAVHLPDGAPAKLAMYFPQTDDLETLRPVIEAALVRRGQSPAVVLRNTSDSSKDEVDAFNRLNDPRAPHRVILLVNKGTEGWNCPSLFACALARRLRTSNNFVLQAATRCLRQVPGNARKARIYLSRDNRSILDRQLQETYGETIADLYRASRAVASARLVLRKADRPPVVLRRLVRTVAPLAGPATALHLVRPAVVSEPSTSRRTLDIATRPGLRRVLQEVGEAVTIEAVADVLTPYEAAVDLAATFRLDLWSVHDEVRRLYGDEVPSAHLSQLALQVADQTRGYEVREEEVEWALALVKPSGFTRVVDDSGTEVYVAEIAYPKDRERLLNATQVLRENPGGFGFHYDPYNFDSGPEQQFFQNLLAEVNLHPSEVEDVYFMGGLTDPAKTDFYVDYLGEDGRWHRYTPDFVIRKLPARGGKPGSGRVLIVEVKSQQFRAATEEDDRRFARGEPPITTEGRKTVALRKLERLNPDRLKYELVFVNTAVTYDQLEPTRRFVREPEAATPTDLAAARRLAQRIVAADGGRVSRVLLFGSRARGGARPDSDFDLLVVLHGLHAGEKRSYLRTLYDLLADETVVAEPWVMSEEEFQETKAVVGGLAHPAWLEGIAVYEKP